MYVSPLFTEYFNGVSLYKFGSSLYRNTRACDSEKENQRVSHQWVKNANPEKPPDQFLFLEKRPATPIIGIWAGPQSQASFTGLICYLL